MKKIYNAGILFIASGFFTGYAPVASGTFGSVVGAALYYITDRRLHLGHYGSVVLAVLLYVVGTVTASRAEEILHEQDSGKIVIDEIAGMYITMLFVPAGLVSLLIGFVCFRFFDILKPYPISYIDKNIHGGTGVMLDDVLAAVLANVVLHLILLII